MAHYIDVQDGGLSTQNGVHASVIREGDHEAVVRGSGNATASGPGSFANTGITRRMEGSRVASSGPATLSVEPRTTVLVKGATSVSLMPAA